MKSKLLSNVERTKDVDMPYKIGDYVFQDLEDVIGSKLGFCTCGCFLLALRYIREKLQALDKGRDEYFKAFSSEAEAYFFAYWESCWSRKNV